MLASRLLLNLSCISALLFLGSSTAWAAPTIVKVGCGVDDVCTIAELESTGGYITVNGVKFSSWYNFSAPNDIVVDPYGSDDSGSGSTVGFTLKPVQGTHPWQGPTSEPFGIDDSIFVTVDVENGALIGANQLRARFAATGLENISPVYLAVLSAVSGSQYLGSSTAVCVDPNVGAACTDQSGLAFGQLAFGPATSLNIETRALALHGAVTGPFGYEILEIGQNFTRVAPEPRTALLLVLALLLLAPARILRKEINRERLGCVDG